MVPLGEAGVTTGGADASRSISGPSGVIGGLLLPSHPQRLVATATEKAAKDAKDASVAFVACVRVMLMCGFRMPCSLERFRRDAKGELNPDTLRNDLRLRWTRFFT